MNNLFILIGVLLGAFLTYLYQRYKLGHYQEIQNRLIQQGEHEAELIKQKALLQIKEREIEKQNEFTTFFQKEKNRLQRDEEKLESRMSLMEKKLVEIEKKEALLNTRKEELEKAHLEIKIQKNEINQTLETLSGLTQIEAKSLIIKSLNDELKNETSNLIRKAKLEAEETAEKEASRIIATAISRLSVQTVSDATIHTVSLPNDEIKGRIIGREGRNIRTLEKETGVNFLLDDTPNAVVISGFDPTRLHIAKIALTDLIQDGRIHPTSIEEAVEKAKEQVEKKIIEYGRDACLRVGITDLHPELGKLLGKLKLRFSLGQNVLDHSIEVSHLMGMIAAELKLDVRLAKRIGLMHDIGKAVSQEIEGTHALIGRNLSLKYGESPEVANGIGCHHQEIEPITTEACFIAAADAISGARPGARLEAVDEYIKRLHSLEKLAYEFPAVVKAYAMQAGREIVTVVNADKIDDAGTLILARDLTRRIEKELNYPGKIKVTVLREQKAIQYAL